VATIDDRHVSAKIKDKEEAKEKKSHQRH